MQKIKFASAIIFSALSSAAFAQDISGTRKNIDDKTGSSKALIEIRQEANGSFTGRIIKVTPRRVIHLKKHV